VEVVFVIAEPIDLDRGVFICQGPQSGPNTGDVLTSTSYLEGKSSNTGVFAAPATKWIFPSYQYEAHPWPIWGISVCSGVRY
jgi:hypothetical protein